MFFKGLLVFFFHIFGGGGVYSVMLNTCTTNCNDKNGTVATIFYAWTSITIALLFIDGRSVGCNVLKASNR